MNPNTMNSDNLPPAPSFPAERIYRQADTASPKPKRTRKASPPRAKKTIDPGIAAIRVRMAEEVKVYRSAQASNKILKTFIEKRLPKLIPIDRQELFDELSKTETPKLTLEEENAAHPLPHHPEP